MVHLQNEVLEQQHLVLGNEDSYYLGPNLTLQNCTLVLKLSAKALTITTVRFVDCRIEAKKALSSFYWLDAFITGCSFSGRFTGSDFGNWPGHFDPGGCIEHCDFSKAILDRCRFIGCDSSTLKFPSWPCFTILDPASRLKELQSVRWPGRASTLFERTVDEFAPNTAAHTYYAPTVEKLFDANQDELRAVLDQVGGVLL